MSTFFKAFKYASMVSVSINIIGCFIAISIGGVESTLNDYKEIFLIPISLLFFPCFFSVYYFKGNSTKGIIPLLKSIIKPASLSFVLIYIIVYVTMSFLKERDVSISFWNVTSLFNAITAVVITVFVILIYYLTINKSLTETNYVKASLSTKNIVLIWLIGTVLYLSIVSILSRRMPAISYTMVIILFGVFATLIATFGLKYAICKQNKSIAKTIVIIVYFINLILFPLLYLEFSGNLFQYNSSLSIWVKTIRGVVLFGGYFLLLTLSVHIYFIYKINMNQKQNLKQIGIAASLKYQQLKAQLSPHFLFNNISVLTGLIEEDQERAIQFSEKLSHVYRYFLNHENQDLVLLKDELVFAKEYLELLQVRFENAITFTNKTKGFSEYYILPLALQQVFENVIKHNEVSMESLMSIEMAIEENYLVVKNNKNPKGDVGEGKQTGLENIINRYVFFTDEKVIIINDKHYYTIKLPLLKTED